MSIGDNEEPKPMTDEAIGISIYAMESMGMPGSLHLVRSLKATVDAKNEEIARLRGSLDGPREAMKAKRDHWRQWCIRLEDALREVVDAHFAFGLRNEPRETRAFDRARALLSEGAK